MSPSGSATSDFVAVRFAGRLPRTGSEPGECEDAWALSAFDGGGPLRAAVADGASESLFAARWAESVARAYVDAGVGGLNEAVTAAAAEWRAFADDQELPWYAEPKRTRGAHTTLIGVEVRNGGIWEAAAIGDSCAFLVRDGRSAVAFPVPTSDAFPSLPVLVGTNDGLAAEHLRHYEGQWRPGDDLYLMSDALAAWFLAEAERQREPWRWFQEIGTLREPERAFRERIGELRGAGRLRNDDVALVHLHFPPAP